MKAKSTYCTRAELLDLFGYNAAEVSRQAAHAQAKKLVAEYRIAEYPKAGANEIIYLRSEVEAIAKRVMKPLPVAA